MRRAWIALSAVAALLPAGVAPAESIRPAPIPAVAILPRLQPLRVVPVIASVAPAGCITYGMVLTMTGTSFGADATGGFQLAVQVGSAPFRNVTATSWSPTSITFTLPATLGITAGTSFTAGLHNGTAFVAGIPLTLCAAAAGKIAVAPIGRVSPAEQSVAPSVRGGPGSALVAQTMPRITSVSPTTCVKSGDLVQLRGSNFGSTRLANMALAVQAEGGVAKSLAESSWSATSIDFSFPAGLAPGSRPTVGILSGGSFAASTTISVCGLAKGAGVRRTRKTSTGTTVTGRTPGLDPSVMAALWSRTQPGDSGGAPAILSVSPVDCVNVGSPATAEGVNLGTSSTASGLSLGFQVDDGQPSGIAATSWSPTGIGFVVPAQAGLTGCFTLGLFLQGEFFQQFTTCTCAAYSSDGWGYDYGGDYGGSYGGDYNTQATAPAPVAGPKGARVLSTGAVTVQIAPAPVPAANDPAPPPAKRAVGAKLLAMKALSARGLRKVNKECDLFDANCPCCRKDDSVCLEKLGDNQDGSSAWVVRWKQGAKTADGKAAFDARSAEADLEAVTELQCEPAAAGAGEQGSSSVTLGCR